MSFVMKGVDISSHQKPSSIDYRKLKNAGINFVILRAGMYGKTDTAFNEHYKKAKDAGLYVGAYYYVTSDKSGNYEQTNFCKKGNWKINAETFESAIKGKTFDMGLWLDYEPTNYAISHNNGTSASEKRNATDNALEFCKYFNSKYYVGIYGSAESVFNERYYKDELKNFAWWVARYPYTKDKAKANAIKSSSNYKPDNACIWQYTDIGTFNGSNTVLDANYCYSDIPSKVKKKSNPSPEPQKQKIPFQRRRRRPAEGNLFYQCNQNRAGVKNPVLGYNPCIEGNKKIKGEIHYPNCALRNCTGYVHGRKMEAESWSEKGILVTSTELSTGHASTYYDHKDKYKRGQTPKLGAVACWKGGEKNRGHVAYVEAVGSNGTCTVSESNWESGKYFNEWTGNPKDRFKSLTFQGYIYTDVEWS